MRPQRPVPWMILAGVVACTVVVGAVLLGSADPDEPDSVVEDVMPQAVRNALGDRVVGILESGEDSSFVTDDVDDGGHVACAAHVYGAEPPGLTRAADATRVYVHAHCRTYHAESEDTWASVAPLVVDFAPEVRVIAPQDGSGYAPSVRRMFPRRLHGAAFADVLREDLAARARARAAELADDKDPGLGRSRGSHRGARVGSPHPEG